MRLFGEFLNVEAIYHPMNRHQDRRSKPLKVNSYLTLLGSARADFFDGMIKISNLSVNRNGLRRTAQVGC
jgi:hypothetical protein